MLVLAFDTSTMIGAVGWIRAPQEAPVTRVEASDESALPARPGHAETLMARIEATLASGGHRIEEVDLVVYGRGPGTFTGLRIGLATAKGLALARGVPLKGLSSLESLALSAGVDGPVAPVIDARRGEIFTAIYDVTRVRGRPAARPLTAERVIAPAGFGALVAEARADRPVRLAGDGAQRYREQLAAHGELLPASASAVSAYWMAVIGLERFLESGGDDPAGLEPVYLREPDARLPDPG